jgi:hypothetical protein
MVVYSSITHSIVPRKEHQHTSSQEALETKHLPNFFFMEPTASFSWMMSSNKSFKDVAII